jgi:hypothetical protein
MDLFYEEIWKTVYMKGGEDIEEIIKFRGKGGTGHG